MTTALTKAARLKPEVRLGQAISEFQADCSSLEKATLRSFQAAGIPPGIRDVMQLTAEINRSAGLQGRCFGSRLTNILQAVQEFAALGDIVLGASQSLLACGIWALRVGHVSESATPSKLVHASESDAIQTAITPPKMPKSSKELVEQEGRLCLAVESIQKNHTKSIREAARVFQVPRSTLQDRLNGLKFRKDTRANSHKLTSIEEESLEKWIISLD